MKSDVKKGEGLSWKDVDYSEKTQSVAVRREMEAIFRKEFEAKKGKTNGANGSH